MSTPHPLPGAHLTLQFLRIAKAQGPLKGEIMTRSKMVVIPFVFTFAALILMSTTPVVHAGEGGWWMNEEIQQKLELSPDQVKKIGEVENHFAGKLRAMKIEKQKAYKNMIRHLDSETLSEEDFVKAQARMQAVYGENAAASANRWKALRSTMTLQQWKNLPAAAPKVLQLGSISTSFRGKVRLGSPPAGGK